jgi:magnesium and cobalt transporter
MNDNETGSSDHSSWINRLRRVLKGEVASRAELLEILSDARWRRVVDKEELAMMQGVLQVGQMQVREVMVPRSQMVVIEDDAPRDAILKAVVECGHSRFPVIGEDRDQVQGILLAKDVLRFIVETPEKEFSLKDSLRQATFIPESKRLDTLLEEFRATRNHMAIVVDEYGGTAGLLTIEDVLEQIVGDIDDEHDPQEVEPIQEQGSGKYQVMALTRIDDFNEYFDVALEDEDYDTVGGLIMHTFGRLPRRGEAVALGGLRFRITQADRRRIHSLEVSREPAQPSAE